MPVLYYKTISTHVYVYDNAFYNSHSVPDIKCMYNTWYGGPPLCIE